MPTSPEKLRKEAGKKLAEANAMKREAEQKQKEAGKLLADANSKIKKDKASIKIKTTKNTTTKTAEKKTKP